MPRGDRTGPFGEGPRTGRGMGLCNGNRVPGFGQGRGRGMAQGRGWRRGIGSQRFAQGNAGSENVSWEQMDRMEQLEGMLEDLKEELLRLKNKK